MAALRGRLDRVAMERDELAMGRQRDQADPRSEVPRGSLLGGTQGHHAETDLCSGVPRGSLLGGSHGHHGAAHGHPARKSSCRG